MLKALNLFILTLLLIFSISCTNNRKNEQYKIFRYNESAGITSLDPAFAKDQANIWVCNQLYNGLVQFDDKLNILPCIAKSWEIKDKGLTYLFHLRKDVYFHNHKLFNQNKDKIVNAEDFVYSFNRILDPSVASPGKWVFANIKQINNKYCFTAINDSTFEIQLNEAFPPFLSLLCMTYCSVLPRKIVDFYGNDFRKNPVGTGPFKFKIWKEGVKLVLLKNEIYFEKEGRQPLPYLDAINVSFIIDKQIAFLEFIKGKLDFISGIDPNYKDEILTFDGALKEKYKNKINLSRQAYLNTEYLGFLMKNNKNSPLNDKKVRQAINYGIDRVKMVKYLRNNIGKPGVFGMIPPGIPSFDSVNIKGYNYNPTKAKLLLREAGYQEGNEIEPVTLYTTAAYVDLCKYIQHQLTDIGLTINIEITPPATLRQRIAKSDLPFFRASWIADYPDAENYLSLFYTPNHCPAGPNYTHFSLDEFDKLYNKAKTELNDSLRYKYYKIMDKLILDEAPVVVLYYDEVLRFTRKNIQNLGNNPMNLLTLKYTKKL